MKAFHNNSPDINVHGHPESDPVVSQFQTMHSELQQNIDDKTLVAFNAGRLLCKNQSTGEIYKPDKIFLPSRTVIIEVINDEGHEVRAIEGGWISKFQAKQTIEAEQLKNERRESVARHAGINAFDHLFGKRYRPALANAS